MPLSDPNDAFKKKFFFPPKNFDAQSISRFISFSPFQKRQKRKSEIPKQKKTSLQRVDKLFDGVVGLGNSSAYYLLSPTRFQKILFFSLPSFSKICYSGSRSLLSARRLVLAVASMIRVRGDGGTAD